MRSLATISSAARATPALVGPPASYISRTFPLAIRGRSASAWSRGAMLPARSGGRERVRQAIASRRARISPAWRDVVASSRRSRRGRGRAARSSAASSSRSGMPSSQARWASSWTIAVGVVARGARLDERQQHPLGEQRAVGQLEVRAHALGVDGHVPARARSCGAGGSRAGSSSRAGSRARPRSGRCRARATARRSRAPPGRCRAARARGRRSARS